MFRDTTLLCNSPFSHTCHVPRRSHSSWYEHSDNICWWVLITKLNIVQSAPFPCYVVPVRPKYLPQHPVLDCPQTELLCLHERPNFSKYAFFFLTPRTKETFTVELNPAECLNCWNAEINFVWSDSGIVTDLYTISIRIKRVSICRRDLTGLKSIGLVSP